MPEHWPPSVRPTYIIDLSARGPDDAVHVELVADSSRDMLVMPREFASKLAEICADGKCVARFSGGELSARPAHWDAAPWRLELIVSSDNGRHILDGALVRNDERMPL